jgi:hypothetical protein
VSALRLRFWLLAMDAVARLGGYGSRLYLWALARASACVEWA